MAGAVLIVLTVLLLGLSAIAVVYTFGIRSKSETPVWAAPTEDGFVIAIVYGSRSDWLQNVLADGAVALVRNGDTYLVDRPEIVPMESARAYFPVTLQRIHRRIRVDQCLRVRRLQLANPSAAWITIGGIGERREDADGQVVIRDCLSLTVSFDHNMIDGAPAARFTERFKALIESGYGLSEGEETTAALKVSTPHPQVA